MVDDKPLVVRQQIVPIGVDKLVNCSANSYYFIDPWNIMDRNAAFDIVKEVRLEWSKASQSTMIVDKKSAIRAMRSMFQDRVEIRWALDKIQVYKSRWDRRWTLVAVKILKKMWWQTEVPMTTEGITTVVR